jgi:purine-binding chemotaxis protein CheW
MGRRHVSFMLGGGSYCVPVDQVVQILRNENILRIPKAPPFVVGVVNLRGDVLPVVDLRMRLGLQAEEAARRRRIVVVQLGKRAYGMLVDEVREIVDLEEGAVTEEAATLFGTRAEFVCAVARRGDSMYLLLDLPKVFSQGGAAAPARLGSDREPASAAGTGKTPAEAPAASPRAAAAGAEGEAAEVPADVLNAGGAAGEQ